MQILSGSKPKGTIPKMTNPKGIRPKEPLPKLVYFCRDLTQCTQSTKQLLRYIHAMISFVHGSFWLVYYAWIGGHLTITGLFKFSNYFHLFTFFFYSDSTTSRFAISQHCSASFSCFLNIFACEEYYTTTYNNNNRKPEWWLSTTAAADWGNNHLLGFLTIQNVKATFWQH